MPEADFLILHINLHADCSPFSLKDCAFIHKNQGKNKEARNIEKTMRKEGQKSKLKGKEKNKRLKMRRVSKSNELGVSWSKLRKTHAALKVN